MGTILVILGIIILCSKNDNKAKRHRQSYFGKSDWEKTCDEGGRFFGW